VSSNQPTPAASPPANTAAPVAADTSPPDAKPAEEPLTINLRQVEEAPHKRSVNPARVVALATALIFLALLGTSIYKMASRTVAEPAHSLTRITFDEGLQSDPTWSPDGRYIAYTAVREGVTNIWMQQISVGDPIPITSGPGPNWQPNWSPDGKYIAYRSDAGSGGLFVTPALGGAGQERRIASFGYNPRWSPDSSRVLFQSGSLPWRGVSEFFIVGMDGAPPRKVLEDFFQEHKSLVSISAGWHPDGKRITVLVDDPTQSGCAPRFWTMPVDGGPAVYSQIAPQIAQKFRDLASHSGAEWLIDSEFVWAPAGNAIYLERTFRGARNLWRLNVNPKTLEATSIDQLTSSGGFDTAPALSPDGKQLAFTAASAKINAWLFPFDANRGRITGPGRAVTSPGINAWLTSVSRDGSKLVFSGLRAGETGLWFKSLPDGREVRLPGDGNLTSAPQWSPDGTRLAYYQMRHNPDEGQLMLWSEQTRQEEPLTSSHPLGDRRMEFVYDWTPDGKSLLISKARTVVGAVDTANEAPGEFPDLAVWQVPISAAPHAESQERMIIADPRYALYQAHQSPDGRWIVFQAVMRNRPQELNDGPSSLYVMRASGGPWLPIIRRNWADKPRWSPDGRTIYFLWGPGSFNNVWEIRFDPDTGKTVGDPFRVTALDNPALMIPAPMDGVEISVTQKNLVLSLNQVSGSIAILDNADR
jgi:Tol biopolymer transport system component